MKVRTGTRRIITLVLAASVAGGATGGAALAAGTSVSLKVKGEYAKLVRSACGKHKEFRAFRRSSRIEFRGFVMPAPAGHFPARVKVERCARGHWRKAADYSITGKKLTGKFKGFFRAAPLAPRSRHHKTTFSYYKAKAIYNGVESPEAYFTVRS